VEVERRLRADNNDLSDDFNLKYVGQALKDWKIWINMFLTVGLFTPLYSVALFLPTIVKGMGYSNNTAQLMSAPPYVSACIMTIAGSYAADKFKQRGVLLLGYQLIAIFGFILLARSEKPHIQYAGSFFAAAGMSHITFCVADG
jgi:predicted MFS family arabinose efflux permease